MKAGLNLPGARIKPSQESSLLLGDLSSGISSLRSGSRVGRPLLVEEFTEAKSTNQRSRKLHPFFLPTGWRFGIALCAILAAVILLVNVIILAWSVTNYQMVGGVCTVFSGNCETAKKFSTWLHLCINILSSVLLGASNYCMQCLTSPTREAIDRAHSKRKWLSIGIPNFRNLPWIGWKKVVLWTLLAGSSVPLHLLWNSAVFDELAANSYVVGLFTEDFLHGGPAYVGAYQQFFNSIRENATNPKMVHNLTNTACINGYSSSPFVSSLGNVILIAHGKNDTNAFLNEVYVNPADSTLSFSWICPLDSHVEAFSGNCNPASQTKHASTWAPLDPSLRLGYETSIDTTVKYCLAEARNSDCHLGIAPFILVVVVICNFTKLLCFLLVLYLGTRTPLHQNPLVTIGDAIESFLNNPDPHMEGRALITKNIATKSPSLAFTSPSHPTYPICFTGKQLCWYRAVSWPRWLACLIPSIILIIVGPIFVNVFSYPIQQNHSLIISSGFGRARPDELILSSEHHSLPSNSLLANTPQLLLSYIYLTYNSIFTSMLTTHEYVSFATNRRGLRVTSPKPNSFQRSQYYLSLPYKYSLPLLVGSALLHWLVSQSIFLIRVTMYDLSHRTDEIPALSAVGYSPLAIVISSTVGAALVIVILALGIFRRFNGKMPISAGCSAVIAAVCHPRISSQERSFDYRGGAMQNDGEEDGEGDTIILVEKEIQFGVAREYNEGARAIPITVTEGEMRVMHASLQSGNINPLQKGMFYA
ncbi:hypothetical protein B7463_g12067, partial [Scytalidium lignicola]